jgi:hypothetical protein
MDHEKSPPPVPAYLLGVLLAYGICVLISGRLFATRLLEIVSLGLVSGLCPMVIVGPAHFLVQRLTYPIVSQFMTPVKMRRWGVLLMNLPALFVMGSLLLSMGRTPSAASRVARFKELTGQAPPPSVEVLGYNIQKGMGEGSCIIPIRISEADLANLITYMGLSEIRSETNELILKRFRNSAANAGAPTFQFEPPVTIYGAGAKKGITTNDKRLIVGRDQSEVLLQHFFH